MIILHQPYSEFMEMPIELVMRCGRSFSHTLNTMFSDFKNIKLDSNKPKKGMVFQAPPIPESWRKFNL